MSKIELLNSSPSIWRILTDQTPKLSNTKLKWMWHISLLSRSQTINCQNVHLSNLWHWPSMYRPGLHSTRYLIMVYMCAQLLGNPMMHGWHVGQTSPISRSTFKCDLNLWGTGLGLLRPMSTHHGEHCVPSNLGILWCMVKMWPGQGTVLSNSTHFDLWPLSVTLAFQVQAWVHHGEHLYQVSWKCHDA